MMKKIGFWISSVVLLIGLCLVISQFYQYYRTNQSGIETDAVIIDIPTQSLKSGQKEMTVAIGEKELEVYISLDDYKNKRYEVGQTVKVKYDAALKHAVLSGKTNTDLWFSICIGIPFVAWLMWSNWRKIQSKEG